VAVAGSVLAVGGEDHVDAGFAAATHPIWWATAGLGATIAVLALVAGTPWARRSVDRIAHLFAEQPEKPEQQAPSAQPAHPASRPPRRPVRRSRRSAPAKS
jgi:lysylphosphatidylglycerol synthetase-like protein (DUF2156 family)